MYSTRQFTKEEEVTITRIRVIGGAAIWTGLLILGITPGVIVGGVLYLGYLRGKMIEP
jgi:hypothetical protein